jgi:hypothetical protein
MNLKKKKNLSKNILRLIILDAQLSVPTAQADIYIQKYLVYLLNTE